MKIIHMMPLAILAISAGACAATSDHATQLVRERRACAAVGFDPGAAQFTQCVADLDSSVLQSEGDQQR